MCLHSVESTDMVGYKYFFDITDTGTPISSHYHPAKSKALRLGRWYKSSDVMLSAWDNKDYKSGFHICLTWEDFKKYHDSKFSNGILKPNYRDKTFKVRYRNVVAFGKQSGATVVVAKEINVVGLFNN